LRSVLPCEVRVTSGTHPLSGRLVAARSFKRLHGELLLVIVLPDGSPGTIRADATDVLGDAERPGAGTVLDAAGWMRLRAAVGAGRPVSDKRRHGMHSLRHTLATRLMEGGTPVEQIAGILGHQSVQSTGVYLKSSLGLLSKCALDPDAPAREASQ
jgi:hypothetical protein